MSGNWVDSEIRELLNVRAQDDVHRYITGTVKDGPILEKIARQLQERGYKRDKGQVTSKLKNVRKKFLQVMNHNSITGNEQIRWPFFDQCYAIWGPGRPENSVPLLSGRDEAAPGEAAGPSPPPSPSLYPVDVVVEANGLDTDAGADDDTDEKPPLPKKRKVTRAQVATREIKDLLIAMDRQDDHRERLRAERQWAHEEQLRKEAREAERRERAEQMSAFEGMFREIHREMQSQTAVLRDLISRMPVQQTSTRHYSSSQFSSQPEY